MILGFLSLVCVLKGVRFFDIYLLRCGCTTRELRYGLILLSIWVVLLSILASASVERKNNFNRKFSTTTSILLLALVFTFRVQDYLGFYIRFEVTLLPTLLLVLGWGYQPERVQAGMYILFYTLLGSLPLLVCLLVVGGEAGSFNFIFHQNSVGSNEL